MRRLCITLLTIGAILVSFPKAFAIALKFEGGYVNDPRDPGGETKYGISKRAYPDEDIKAMTKDRAAKLYLQDYWHPAGCEDLPPKLAIVHFDTAVNMGVRRSISILKEAVGVTAETNKRIGELTKAEIKTWQEELLVSRYLGLRLQYYHKLVEKNPRLKVFLKGWTNRVLHLQKEVLGGK